MDVSRGDWDGSVKQWGQLSSDVEEGYKGNCTFEG